MNRIDFLKNVKFGRPSVWQLIFWGVAVVLAVSGFFLVRGLVTCWLLLLVVGREVGADRLPGVAEIPAAEHHVAREVDGLAVVGRGHDRRVPVEAVLEKGGGPAGVPLGLRADVQDRK